jgi:hypothetical protein
MGRVYSLSRNEQLVKYVIERLSGQVGRIRLMKYLYLADLEARRYLGHPLSRFEYHLDRYGPFDAGIYNVLDSLKTKGLIGEDLYPWQGSTGFVYHDSSEPVVFSLSPAERYLLEYVIRKFHAVEMSQLLEDIVYETWPMKKATQHGELLDMDAVNNTMKQRLKGIDFDRLLLGEQQIREGNYTTLDDVLKELGRARPGGSTTTTS